MNNVIKKVLWKESIDFKTIILERVHLHDSDYNYVMNTEKSIENSNYSLTQTYIARHIFSKKGENFYPIYAMVELTYPGQFNLDFCILIMNKIDGNHYSLIISYDKFHELYYQQLSSDEKRELKTIQSRQREIAEKIYFNVETY